MSSKSYVRFNSPDTASRLTGRLTSIAPPATKLHLQPKTLTERLPTCLILSLASPERTGPPWVPTNVASSFSLLHRTLLFPAACLSERRVRNSCCFARPRAQRRAEEEAESVTRRCAWPGGAFFQEESREKRKANPEPESPIQPAESPRCTVTKGRSRDCTSPYSVTSHPLASPPARYGRRRRPAAQSVPAAQRRRCVRYQTLRCLRLRQAL